MNDGHNDQKVEYLFQPPLIRRGSGSGAGTDFYALYKGFSNFMYEKDHEEE